nr:DUF805 domain-containing protein [Massilia mucilaginosa]
MSGGGGMEETDNPYAAPAPGAFYTPSVFGLHGRIGRGRYLMYSLFPTCATLLLLAPTFMVYWIFLMAVVIGLALLALLSHLLIVAARRLDDLDRPRRWSLLLVVPGLNLLLVLYLLGAPGDPGANAHGPAPTSGVAALTRGAWLACALPPCILLALYLLAALTLPV